MIKKIILFLAIFVIASSYQNVYADNDPQCPADDTGCLEKAISFFTTKVNDLETSKNTLSNQIKLLDSQISLTILKIDQTKASIKILESEISTLSTKIDQLNVYLDQLSAAYISQVNQNYRLEKRVPAFAYLIASNFNNYWNQQKYVTAIQKNSQDNLLAMETSRTTYDIQKSEKTKKQQDLQDLQKQLATQQTSLDKQKTAKNNLLAETQNNEKIYQQKLQDALAQLNALRNFSKIGGSICLSSSPGSGSDGNFFSQRDPSWCRQNIGLSKDVIGEVGCYISSLSMVYKKLGVSITPSTYASNPSNFYSTTAYMNNPTPPSGYTYKQVSYSTNTIDSELDKGRYVIAQISMKNISGMHFIVIISGANGSYKIHDPWYGPDQNFSDHYIASSVMSLRLITK